MLTLHQRVLLNSERGAILEAVSTPRGISAWWMPGTAHVDGTDDIVAIPFGTVEIRYRVITSNDGHGADWTPVDVPDFWENCPISFVIVEAPYPGWCHLELNQPGYHDRKLLADCSYGWGQYLRSLKLLLETGQGEPYGSVASLAAGTTPPDL